MRPERLYLDDIASAAAAIRRFAVGQTLETFIDNELLQSAILQKLIVIGEAAGRVQQDVRQSFPAIPWRSIVAFRNFAVHEYFAVHWPIVWTVVTDDIPALETMIATVLAEIPD